MKKGFLASALAGFTLLGACSSVVPPGPGPAPGPAVVAGSELYGRSIRVESGGRTSIMTFRPGGKVDANFNGRTLTGDWAVEPGRICFTWGGFRDCWPYQGLWRRNTPVNLTSERGTAVRLTLL
ncbi:MAG TPA: hypothetical protein VGD10_05760 [Allosphingosinicella sp.]|uniref:hypothetical protein n=1 Tax=Allosphingosinicella sp. TaxID=2823234 RepID=UPI002ED81F4D